MMYLALTAMSLALSAPVAVEPAPIPAPLPAQVAPARNATTRYCIVETMTDSRIPKRVCHTRAEWKSRGTDIPADK